MSAQLSPEAAVASAEQGPELLGSPDLTPAGEPAASASQAESQELVFGSLGDFDSAALDAVLQETAHDPELVSLEELAKSLREPNVASGLHLGPAPASPAGSLGRASPVGGPPSVVLSPTFSWGAHSDAEEDPGSETRWWNQVRDSEPESGPAGVSSSSGSFDFAATFRMAVQAQWRMPEREPLKQPWEQGIFGELFGSGGPELLPTLKRSVPTILKEDGAPSGGAETAAVKRSRIQREAQFEIGIDLWMTLMKGWSSCSFVDLLDAELPGDAQRGVISDIFRRKAPSTLLKRGRAIANFQSYLEENLATFPCVERELYQYLKHLEKHGAPKSRCSGLLEALAFVRHVVGVEEVECLLKSRRCRGLGVVESFKESKQAPALTVAQLRLLHEALESHQDPWTRHFAGCALVATFSRCRWSDIQHSVQLIVDRGQDGELIYLELRIGVHKTCRLQSKRHRFLHVVSPSLGLKQFGELWLKSRRDIGLSDEKNMPFCPVPDASGRPTVRGIESDEATTWLRLLLKSEPGKEIEPSSKSFKATILSWAAKRGVDGLSIQRLGYHASGGLDIVYSRDAQAPYILLVEKLLAEVRDGSPEVGAPVPQLVKEEIRSDLSAGSFVVVNATESEAEGDLVSLGSSTDSADEYEHQPVAMVARGDAGSRTKACKAPNEGVPSGALQQVSLATRAQCWLMSRVSGCTEAEVPGGHSGWESLHVFVSAEHTHLQAVGIRYRNAEATAYVIQALKDQVSADNPEGQVRKMPMAERVVNHILESGLLVWVPPSMCGKRDTEVAQGIEHKTSVVQIEKEALKVAAPESETKADLTTPLLMHFAFQRRGIAFDQCGLIDWATHQDYLHRLLSAMSAPVPPGFHPVTATQVVRADKELFTIMARECPPPFKVRADGTKPLNVALKSLMLDSRIQMWLLPSPGGVASKVPVGPDVEAPAEAPPGVPAPPKKPRIRKKAKKVIPDSLKGCKKFGRFAGGYPFAAFAFLDQTQSDLHQDAQRKGFILDVSGGPQWLPAAAVCQLHELGFQLQRPVQTAEHVFNRVPSSLCVDDMLVIQLFCGSAGLSWACHRLGFQVMPIWHKQPDAKPRLRVHQLDLANADSVHSLQHFIITESHRIAMIWAAVPENTVSAAREKPIPRLQRLNLPVPQPLRSTKRPHGLDGLVGRDKQRCEVANRLYQSVSTLFQAALERGVRCVLENAASSLFWQTDYFKSLAAMHAGSTVQFHMCQHGGARPKLLQLWTSDHAFDSLAAQCPGAKLCKHEPWIPVASERRQFIAASSSSAYPQIFCERVAGMLKQVCRNTGVRERLSLPDAVESSAPKLQRLALGLQPAGASLPQLLPEYSHRLQVVVVPSNSPPASPQHAVLLSRRLLMWGEHQAEKRTPTEGVKFQLDPTSLRPDSLIEVFTFGIPASPEAFVKRAVACGHPADFESSLEPILKEVVKENIVGDEVKLAKARLAFIAKWRSRAKALEKQEAALHEEMVERYNLPDTNLVSDMLKGFSLSGWMPSSGSFPPSAKRPELSVESLKILSSGFNAATLQKTQVRQDDDLEKATWEETLSEEANGWIWKCSEQQMDGKVVARRFGILQGSKIRVIDDLSCCGLNATVGLREKFVLHSIDKMAAMLAYATSLVTDPDFSLCGRTYDLKSAYKQFPICQRDFDLLRFMVAEISACIWQIGVLGLRALWTAFFDDYSVVSKESLKKNTAYAIESLFSLLGLDFAKEGKKEPAFCEQFGMLGLSVDLRGFKQGKIEIGHTEKRVAELKSALSETLECNRLSQKESERLRGRMNFFEGHAYGRGPAQALRTIDHFARSGAAATRLPPVVTAAIVTLRGRLESAIPLQISARSLATWYLFTDGSCEPEREFGAVGAILYDQSGRAVSAFSEKAPKDVMRRLLKESSNPIYALELYPVLLSYRKWQHLLGGAQVVSFVDNDAAKYSLVRSCSSTDEGASIIEAIRNLELDLQLRAWYSRVPTHSNPADAPSRLDTSGLEGILTSSLSWEVSSTAC
ncbi:unnamed protein product [Symbiodinium sp. CCMP2592]|nr:unnamed protein product [Symbiodinium sp. CCMP2592]